MIGVPSGRFTRCSRGPKGPAGPALRASSTGVMVMKMPANRIATSRIGTQVKAFSMRMRAGVTA